MKKCATIFLRHIIPWLGDPPAAPPPNETPAEANRRREEDRKRLLRNWKLEAGEYWWQQDGARPHIETNVRPESNFCCICFKATLFQGHYVPLLDFWRKGHCGEGSNSTRRPGKGLSRQQRRPPGYILIIHFILISVLSINLIFILRLVLILF